MAIVRLEGQEGMYPLRQEDKQSVQFKYMFFFFCRLKRKHSLMYLEAEK